MASGWEVAVDPTQPIDDRLRAARQVLVEDVPLPRKEHLLWRWATDLVFAEKHPEVVEDPAYWELVTDLVNIAQPDTAELVIPRQFLQVFTTVGKRLTGELPVADVTSWLMAIGACFDKLTQLQTPKLADLNKCLGVFLQSCGALCLQLQRQAYIPASALPSDQADDGKALLLATSVNCMAIPCLCLFASLHTEHPEPRKNFSMLCQRWLPHLFLLHQHHDDARPAIEEVLGSVLFASEHAGFFINACKEPFSFGNTGDDATSDNNTPRTKRPKLGQRSASYPYVLFQALEQQLGAGSESAEKQQKQKQGAAARTRGQQKGAGSSSSRHMHTPGAGEGADEDAVAQADAAVNAAAAHHGIVTLMYVLARRVSAASSSPASTKSSNKGGSSSGGGDEGGPASARYATPEQVMAYNVVKQMVALLMGHTAGATDAAAAAVQTVGGVFRVFGEQHLYVETFDAVHGRVITRWASGIVADLITGIAAQSAEESTAGPAATASCAQLLEATAGCVRSMAACCYLFVEEHLSTIWQQLLPRVWLSMTEGSVQPTAPATAVLDLTRFILSTYAKLRQLVTPAKALADACLTLIQDQQQKQHKPKSSPSSSPPSPADAVQASVATADGGSVRWNDPAAVTSAFLRGLAEAWSAATAALPVGQAAAVVREVVTVFEPAWSTIQTRGGGGLAGLADTPAAAAKRRRSSRSTRKKPAEAKAGSGQQSDGWGPNVVCSSCLWLSMVAGLLTSSVVEMRATSSLCSGMEAVQQHCLKHLAALPQQHAAGGLLLMVRIRLTLHITDLCIVLLRGINRLAAALPDSGVDTTEAQQAATDAASTAGTASTATSKDAERVTAVLASLPAISTLHAEYKAMESPVLATNALLAMTAFLVRQSTLGNVVHRPDLIPQGAAARAGQQTRQGKKGSKQGKQHKGEGKGPGADGGEDEEDDAGHSEAMDEQKEEEQVEAVEQSDAEDDGGPIDATQGAAVTAAHTERLSVYIVHSDPRLVHTLLEFDHPSKWAHVLSLFPVIWEVLGREDNGAGAVGGDDDAEEPAAKKSKRARKEKQRTGKSSDRGKRRRGASTLSAAQAQLCRSMVDALWQDPVAAHGVRALLRSPVFTDTASAHPVVAVRVLRCIAATAGNADTTTALKAVEEAGDLCPPEPSASAVAAADLEAAVGELAPEHRAQRLLELAHALRHLPWLHSRFLCTPALLESTLQVCTSLLTAVVDGGQQALAPALALAACSLVAVSGRMLYGLSRTHQRGGRKAKLATLAFGDANAVFMRAVDTCVSAFDASVVAAACTTAATAVNLDMDAATASAAGADCCGACVHLLASFVGNELLARVQCGDKTDDGESALLRLVTPLQASEGPGAEAAAVHVAVLRRFPPLVRDTLATLARAQLPVLSEHVHAAARVMTGHVTAATTSFAEGSASGAEIGAMVQAFSAVTELVSGVDGKTTATAVTHLQSALLSTIFLVFKTYALTEIPEESLSMVVMDCAIALSRIGRGVAHLPLSVFEKLYASLARVCLQAKALSESATAAAALQSMSAITKHFSREQVLCVLEFVGDAVSRATEDATALRECVVAVHQYRALLAATSRHSPGNKALRQTCVPTVQAILRILQRLSEELFVCQGAPEALEAQFLNTDAARTFLGAIVALLRSDNAMLPEPLATGVYSALTMLPLPAGPDRHQANWERHLPTLFATSMQLIRVVDQAAFELQTKQRRIMSRQMAAHVGLLSRMCSSFLYWSSCISSVTVEKHLPVLRVLNAEYGWVPEEEAAVLDDTRLLHRLRETLTADATRLAGKISRLFEDLATSRATLGKFAPYVLSACLVPLSTLMLPATTRTAFLSGMYPLVEMCTTYDRDLIHAALPTDARPLFRRLYDDYKRFYMYKGQI